MLTKLQVEDYLQNKLCIQDVSRKLISSRLEFLNELMRKIHSHVPYQNLKLLATPIGKRRLLTSDEIIEDCMIKGLGGTCYVLNMFLNFLLKALGFNVSIAGCTMAYIPNIPNHHLVNLVKGVEQANDLYLLDPAGWYPTFDAVALHNLVCDRNEGKMYKNSFLQYTFVKENNQICRYHLKNNVNENAVKEDGKWRLYYYLSLPSAETSVIAKAISDTYVRRNSGLFSIVIFSLFPPDLGLTLYQREVRKFDEKSGLVSNVKCDSDEKLFEVLKEYWPAVTIELVKNARQNILKPIHE